MRAILITVTLLLAAACSDPDTPEDYLGRAKAFLAAGDDPAAAIELQNALGLDSSSGEARALLGKIHLQRGDAAEAEGELQRAERLGWKPDAVRPPLARALLAQGKFAEVLQLDGASLSPAAAAAQLARQSLAARSQAQPEKARELVAQAKARDAQSLEAQLAEATIAVHTDAPHAAQVLIDAILQRAPGNDEALWLKGQTLSRLGKLEESRAALDESVAHAQASASYRISRVLVNLQLQDYDAARADVTELLKEFPRNPTVNYAHGVLLFEDQQYRKAITALTLAEPAAAQFPQTLYFLGSAYLVENDLEPAAEYARQFVAQAPADSRGLKLLAAILLLQGKADEAQSLLQPALDQNPGDIAALNIAANALLLDDQADLGMLLYARIRQLQRDWQIVPLRQEAALVTPAPRDSADADTEAGTPARDNFPQTEVLQVLDQLQAKNFAGAIESAKAYQFRALGSLAPYHLLGMIYQAAGEPKNARREYERALLQAPADPVSNQALAQMALEANDPAAARRYYQAVLDAHPDHLTTLLQLAALAAKEKDTPAMVARLNQAISAHPGVLEPRLNLAAHYLASGAPAKVETTFATLSELQKRSPRVLDLTGRAQLALQQYDKAQATLQQLVDITPNSADAHYLLAMAASDTGNVPKAKQELLAGARENPRHAPSLVGLVKIARLEGDQDTFERHLATLVEVAPDMPDVLRLRALDSQLQGRPAEALVYAQSAFAKAPSTQALIELAALQKAAGKPHAARQSLERWIEHHPADVAVRLTLANDLQAAGKQKMAQAQYLAVLNTEPGNIAALNNLAWSLRREDPARALAFIRTAVAAAPEVPALLDTLAVVESLNGDHAAAKATMERALSGAPGDPSMRYHQAMIAAARGDKAAAITTLQELLKNAPETFPERADAGALLQSLNGSPP